MSAVAAPAKPALAATAGPHTVGPLGRLGGWTVSHMRAVAIAGPTPAG